MVTNNYLERIWEKNVFCSSEQVGRSKCYFLNVRKSSLRMWWDPKFIT